MLKRDIMYTDFNGEKVIETFYFNLTKTELIELEVSHEGGLQAALQRIIASKDNAAIVEEFKKIVLMAYGEKSKDGKRFIKSDEARQEFSQTAAYDALFMELASDEGDAARFINGVMPAGLVPQGNVVSIPAPPVPPEI